MIASRSRRLLALATTLIIGVLILHSATVPEPRPVERDLLFRDHFDSTNLGAWQMPHPEDWSILSENGNRFLHMNRNREPGVPRRPLQFALLKGANVGSFSFRTRLRREGKSMIVVFNYADTLHFYYTHLSTDSGTKVDVHNGIFIVDGGPRRRIAGTEAAPALPDREWHTAEVHRNVQAGSIDVLMDDQPRPLFSVIDHTFNCGQVGIGSFDETGDFDDILLESRDSGCTPGSAIRDAKSQE